MDLRVLQSTARDITIFRRVKSEDFFDKRPTLRSEQGWRMRGVGKSRFDVSDERYCAK